MQREIILTAKNDKRIEFYDGATHARLAALDMPASVHELALSPDGARAYGSVFGGGVFGRNVDPDHRVVVIDLASRSVDGFIDAGTYLAPHGLAFGADGLLWVTAELNNALLGIDVAARKVVAAIDTGHAAHWLAVHPGGERLYASNKQTPVLGIVDLIKRRITGEVTIPNRCEGVAISADGERLYVASHAAPELNVVDTRSEKLIRSIRFTGTDDERPQLRRVRLTPDEHWALVSSHRDGNVAVFRLPELEQTALIPVGKAPMGFAFPGQADRALVCNHDDGTVAALDLARGTVADAFPTGSGCEYAEFFGPRQ